jgi:uncharacterized membrane protein
MTKKGNKTTEEKTLNFETSKILGGIGALLMFLGVIPQINQFGVIEIIGVVLVLVGLYGIGSYYKEGGIFNNALYGFIAGVVGLVLAITTGIAIVLPNIKDFLTKVFPSWNGDWSTIPSLSGVTPNTSNISFTDIIPFLVAAILVFVILWVFAIVAAFFIRRSLMQVSVKSNVGLFGTSGILLLVGAFLVIVVGFGLILMWIAALILAIAFFQLKPMQLPPS